MQHKYQTVFEHDACIYESHFIDRTVYIQPINKMYKANNSSEMHRLQMSVSVYRFFFSNTVSDDRIELCCCYVIVSKWNRAVQDHDQLNFDVTFDAEDFMW
jgi:hypothetical protein